MSAWVGRIAVAIGLASTATAVLAAEVPNDAGGAARSRLAQVAPAAGGAKGSGRASAGIADLEAQERATAEVWARLPFSARHAMFVSRKAAVFGDYQARPSTVFAPGETLISYMEPTGYAWTPLADETYRFGVSLDWELLTKGGKILGGQKKLLTQEFTSRFKNREFFVTTTMSFDGLGPGDYVLAYTLHDGGSDRTARVEQPFTVKP